MTKMKMKTSAKPKEKKSKEVKIADGHHVKVPINPKDMLKMHVSHMIMQQLGVNK